MRYIKKYEFCVILLLIEQQVECECGRKVEIQNLDSHKRKGMSSCVSPPRIELGMKIAFTAKLHVNSVDLIKQR